jgi:hypothetical protein
MTPGYAACKWLSERGIANRRVLAFVYRAWGWAALRDAEIRYFAMLLQRR